MFTGRCVAIPGIVENVNFLFYFNNTSQPLWGFVSFSFAWIIYCRTNFVQMYITLFTSFID